MVRPLTVAFVLLAAGPAAASYNTGLYAWAIAGKVATACPTAPLCNDGPDALSGRLNAPAGLTVDRAGNVIVADYQDQVVRRIAPSGALTTLTTSGTFATVVSPADAPATFSNPTAVAVHGSTLYVAVDHGGTGGQVLRVANGTISIYAGFGTNCGDTSCGDGGPAANADLTDPEGLAVDAAGNLYIADAGADANRIRKVTPGGTISTVAGSTTGCATPLDGAACGDGGPATSAQLAGPNGVDVTPDGSRIVIADTGDNRVRQVAGGTITTIGGSGQVSCSCSDDDNGPATGPQVGIGHPVALALDTAGNVFVTDVDGQRFRKITPAGTITTVAGGNLFPLPFVGQGVEMPFPQPNGVAVDDNGGLFVTDVAFNQVFWLTPAQPLGVPGPKGDTGAAGANGATGPSGPAGPQGANGGNSPLASWTCRYRRAGLGRNAVTCFARVYADDGHTVRVTLGRGGRTIDSDSATARDGIAKLHLSSRARIRGAFVLRISERSSRGVVSTASVRVAI